MVNAGDKYAGVKRTNDTSLERTRLHAHCNSDSGNPTIIMEHYPASSNTTEDNISVYFDGTNFYVSGKKDGADAVTKKLGESTVTSSTILYSQRTYTNSETKTYSYTFTQSYDLAIVIGMAVASVTITSSDKVTCVTDGAIGIGGKCNVYVINKPASGDKVSIVGDPGYWYQGLHIYGLNF